jgi:hypothetical protein
MPYSAFPHLIFINIEIRWKKNVTLCHEFKKTTACKRNYDAASFWERRHADHRCDDG